MLYAMLSEYTAFRLTAGSNMWRCHACSTSKCCVPLPLICDEIPQSWLLVRLSVQLPPGVVLS